MEASVIESDKEAFKPIKVMITLESHDELEGLCNICHINSSDFEGNITNENFKKLVEEFCIKLENSIGRSLDDLATSDC